MATKETKPKFTKDQLKASVKYVRYPDLIEALLDKDTMYTFDDVDKLLKAYLEGVGK